MLNKPLVRRSVQRKLRETIRNAGGKPMEVDSLVKALVASGVRKRGNFFLVVRTKDGWKAVNGDISRRELREFAGTEDPPAIWVDIEPPIALPPNYVSGEPIIPPTTKPLPPGEEGEGGEEEIDNELPLPGPVYPSNELPEAGQPSNELPDKPPRYPGKPGTKPVPPAGTKPVPPREPKE
jgi:hypothetical protein